MSPSQPNKRKSKTENAKPVADQSIDSGRIHFSTVEEQQELMYQSWLSKTPEERIRDLVRLIKMTYQMPPVLSNRINFTP